VTIDIQQLISILEHFGYKYNLEMSAGGGNFGNTHHCCCSWNEPGRYDPWSAHACDVYDKIFRIGIGKYKERHTLIYYRSMTEEELIVYLQQREKQITEELELINERHI
jgi:hypothetical protein